MKITCHKVGVIRTNCYILMDESSGQAAVIDPGAVSAVLLEALTVPDIRELKYILLTHGHFDHVLGVKKLKEKYPDVLVAIHSEDASALWSKESLLINRMYMQCDQKIQPDMLLSDGMILELGGLRIHALHTPGHTPGGCCFAVEDALFSGDTLFKGDVGRCDLPGGNFKQILESVQKLAALSGDYRVLPGHEDSSTLEAERKRNPYITGAYQSYEDFMD